MVLKTAFKNLAGLRKFFSCFPIQILTDSSVRFPQYSLARLEIKACPSDCQGVSLYKIGSIGLTASMCSSVTKVTVELEKGITNMELFGLLRLQNFWELSINGVKWEEKITFDGGVAPLLKAFGNG